MSKFCSHDLTCILPRRRGNWLSVLCAPQLSCGLVLPLSWYSVCFCLLNTTALKPDKPSPKVIMMVTGFVQGALALMVHYNIIWSNQIIRPHVSVPERIATFDDCCDCGFTYCRLRYTVYSIHIWFWIKIRWSGSPYPVFPAVSLEIFLKLNRARLFPPAGDLKNHKDVLWAANSTQKSLNQRCHLWISLLVYFFFLAIFCFVCWLEVYRKIVMLLSSRHLLEAVLGLSSPSCDALAIRDAEILSLAELDGCSFMALSQCQSNSKWCDLFMIYIYIFM